VADLYTIKQDPANPADEGEKLTVGQIVKRCEEIAIANEDRQRYFVGREAIRGRLRCGIRSWPELTAKVKSRTERGRTHRWRG